MLSIKKCKVCVNYYMTPLQKYLKMREKSISSGLNKDY